MKLDYRLCPLCGSNTLSYFNASICANHDNNISYDHDNEAWYYGDHEISEDELIRLLKLKAFL